MSSLTSPLEQERDHQSSKGTRFRVIRQTLKQTCDLKRTSPQARSLFALSGKSSLVSYFDTHLIARKVFHLLAGAFLIAVLGVLNTTQLFALGTIAILLYWLLSRRISSAVFGPMLLLGLTGSKFVALGASLVLILGDGLAAVIGSTLGRKKWPWCQDKTIEGSLAFLLASFLGVLIFLCLAMPHGTMWQKTIISFFPSLGGCFIEALPIRVAVNPRYANDNLGIVLLSGFLLYLVSAWVDLMPSW